MAIQRQILKTFFAMLLFTSVSHAQVSEKEFAHRTDSHRQRLAVTSQAVLEQYPHIFSDLIEYFIRHPLEPAVYHSPDNEFAIAHQDISELVRQIHDHPKTQTLMELRRWNYDGATSLLTIFSRYFGKDKGELSGVIVPNLMVPFWN